MIDNKERCVASFEGFVDTEPIEKHAEDVLHILLRNLAKLRDREKLEKWHAVYMTVRELRSK